MDQLHTGPCVIYLGCHVRLMMFENCQFIVLRKFSKDFEESVLIIIMVALVYSRLSCGRFLARFDR